MIRPAETESDDSQPKSRLPEGLLKPREPHLLVRQTPRKYIWFARFLKFAAAAYLFILVLMMLLETRLVFPGATTAAGDWSHSGIFLEEVDFPSADGTKIYGYYFPNPKSDRFLLFCHGNGENIAVIASEMELLRTKLNVSVLAYDYRGFGKTVGSPSEDSILADSEAAALWLAEKAGQPVSNLFIMGRSLGGGVAVHLAALYDPELLILDRTFSSTVDVAAERYWWLPVRVVMRNQFWSVVRIQKYAGPLFQMHGDVDEVIPLWSGKKLFAKSPSEDKTFMEIPGLFHNDPWPKEFLDRLRLFVNGEDLEASEPLDTPNASLAPAALGAETNGR